MRTAIEGCEHGTPGGRAVIKCSSQIVYTYWTILIVPQAEGTQETSELNKRIKPRLLAEMRHFELSYFASVFCPTKRAPSVEAYPHFSHVRLSPLAYFEFSFNLAGRIVDVAVSQYHLTL